VYQRDFEKRLQQSPPKAVLLYGESPYIIERYIKYYIHSTQSQERYLSLYYEAYNFQQAKGFLSQSSLFGGVNLLIVKMDKKIPKKELDQLVASSVKNPNNYLLYHYSGSDRDAKALQRSFQSNEAVWVRLFPPTLHDGIAHLHQRAKALQIDIDHYTLQHLMLLLHNDLALCAKELEKLALLEQPVTSSDIDRITFSTTHLATDELLVDLFDKKPIVETMQRLLDSDQDPLSLLRALQYFIHQILLFHLYHALHDHIDSKAILGYRLPKQIEDQRKRVALALSQERILEISHYLLRSELRLKEASSMEREAMIYTIFLHVQRSVIG
jgi:DNA polymerase-3 subunit delta